MDIEGQNKQHFFKYLIVIGIFSYPAFFLFDTGAWGGDMQIHVRFAQHAVKSGKYPPHFIYHLLLNILTGFSGHFQKITEMAIRVMTVFTVLKLLFSITIIDRLIEQHGKKLSVLKMTLFCTLLFFLTPIANWWQFPSILRGQFTPNVWHNPTTIVLMPFCLGLIIFFLNKKNNQIKSSMIGSILLGLSVLVKPSFAMAFLPAIFVLAILKQFTWRECIIYTIPTLVILSWQFFQTFTPWGTMTIDHHKTSVIFAPFLVWSGWTKTPVGSLLVSFAFPISFLYFFSNQIKNKNIMLLSWLLVCISLALFFLLAEEGSKTLHGNFFWSTIPAVYLLFLVTIVELYLLEKPTPSSSFYIQRGFCIFLLLLHFFSGILYYFRIYLNHDFYA